MTWEKRIFSDLFLVSARNGVYKRADDHGRGVKIVNMGDLFAHEFVGADDMSRIEMSEREMTVSGLKEGDLLFARRSLVEEGAGKAAIVQGLTEPTTFESSIIRIRLNSEVCVPLFYFYWAKSYAGRTAISALVTGTNVKGIRSSALQSIEVDYPSFPTQQRIAGILSAYDDLIENARKQIRLLEESAQRLYKEWFIDLHFPGHESTPILDGLPAGWKRKTIGEVCDTIGGGTPSTTVSAYYQGGTIPWVTPTDITRNNALVLLDTAVKITEAGLKGSSAKMLPAETILMTSRASVGFFGLCDFPVCTNQGFINCIPHRAEMQMYLLYNLMSRVDEIRQKASGSTYLEINKSTFRAFEMVVPSDEVLQTFQESTHRIIERTRALAKQIALLTEARDRLLPKLMSGEITV